MLQRRFATGQPQADFAQRIHMCYLAKQHGHKLFPAGDPLDAELGFMLLDSICELSTWKKLQKLRVDTAYLNRGLIPVTLSVALSGRPPQSNGDQPAIQPLKPQESLIYFGKQ